MNDRKQGSREDDFRDYEQRDNRDGWPYSDNDADRRAGQNAPYGAPGANLDERGNKGVEVAADPDTQDVDGAPLPFSDGGEDAIADDDLEERIAQLLEDDGRVDSVSIEITIRDGVAELEGAVDSEEDRRHVIGLVRRVDGLRGVRADGLLARGVDSHIPRDADE
ncbi:MAG: BON domain-containing protein [Rhizobiales bacterium]|nr:BON domain-containing protein [Hyphomicrobiales bacterium]